MHFNTRDVMTLPVEHTRLLSIGILHRFQPVPDSDHTIDRKIVSSHAFVRH